MAKAKPIPDLSAEDSYAEAAARIVSVRAGELTENAQGVLDTGDIERVHDMRVATRRLRAALEIFEPCFPAEAYAEALAEVKRLADALGERRTADVLALAQELMEDGEDAVKILGAMHRSLRQMRAVRALKAQKASREEMAARIGLPANMLFKLPSITEAASRWTDAELEAAVSALGRADRRVKTGSAASVALTEAVAEACRKRGGEARSAWPTGR